MNQPRTERNGQIVKPQAPAESPPQPQGQPKKKSAQMSAESLEAMLLMEDTQIEISRALAGTGFSTERMLRIYLTALRTTRNLIRCTPDSFLGCVLQAAQIGLEPNTPLQQCFLIPRRNYKREKWLLQTKNTRVEIYECTLITGYQGMIELSMRSNRVASIEAMTVRKGDNFRYKYGLTPVLDHELCEDWDREDFNTHPLIYAWALGRIKTGGTPFVVLSHGQVESRRLRSSAGEDGPWVTDYDAMAQKSAIRALWKFLPKSSEMAIADQLETAVELGRSQRSVFDPKVHVQLDNLGIRPLSEETDDDLGLLPVPSETQPLAEALQQGQETRETVKKE